jgi:cytochrome c oxidase subunit III
MGHLLAAAADPEAGRRETPGTSLLDGRVMTRVVLPGPSLWPLGLAIAVAITFIGSLISLWLVPIGALLTYVAIVGWTWPNRARPQAEVNVVAAETPDPQREPVAGSEAPMWWGIVMLIVIETTVFATLITSYFYLNGAAEWPLGGFSPPDLLLPTINLGVLLLSGGAMYWGDRGIHQGNQRRLIIGLLISFALGVVFLVLKYIEYSDNDYLWDTNAYGSVVWTITGFHSAHVIALLLKTLTVLVLAWQGFFTEKRNLGVEVNGFYWQFVVVVWLPLYAVLYLAPRWL